MVARMSVIFTMLTGATIYQSAAELGTERKFGCRSHPMVTARTLKLSSTRIMPGHWKRLEAKHSKRGPYKKQSPYWKTVCLEFQTLWVQSSAGGLLALDTWRVRNPLFFSATCNPARAQALNLIFNLAHFRISRDGSLFKTNDKFASNSSL